MGGIAVVVGFFAGGSVLLMFDHLSDKDLLNISLSAILGATLVGVMDDMFDMRQRHKVPQPFILAPPQHLFPTSQYGPVRARKIHVCESSAFLPESFQNLSRPGGISVGLARYAMA